MDEVIGVKYKSSNGDDLFVVDKQSSEEMNKYIQLLSVQTKGLRIIVNKKDVVKPCEKEKDKISQLFIKMYSPKKEQRPVFKPKEYKLRFVPSGMYGKDLIKIMKKNKIRIIDLSRACKYKSPSSVQKCVYNPDKPISMDLWNRFEKGLTKIKLDRALCELK